MDAGKLLGVTEQSRQLNRTIFKSLSGLALAHHSNAATAQVCLDVRRTGWLPTDVCPHTVTSGSHHDSKADIAPARRVEFQDSVGSRLASA